MAKEALFVREVNNAIFCPRGTASPTHDVVYDQDGRLVYESTVPRGYTGNRKHKTEATAAPDTFDLTNASQGSQKDSLLFLGNVDNAHFGHWLTEGISRLWPLLDSEFSPRIVWATSFLGRLQRLRYSKLLVGAAGNHWRHSLSAFNIQDKRLLSLSRPTQIRKLLVPSPSMQNRAQIHPLHLEVGHRIGSHLLKGQVNAQSGQPVYFSRCRLPPSKRKIVGESLIEEYCRKRGALIVYPEKLSLAEQVEMVDKHDVFIGPVGSAFHALILRNSRRPVKCVYLTGEQKGDFPRNWELIDCAMNNQVVNIVCLSGAEGKMTELDLSSAFEHLNECF